MTKERKGRQASNAVADVFGNAEVVERPPKESKKNGSGEEVELEELDTLVFAKIVTKALEGVIKSFDAKAKEKVTELFIEKIEKSGKKPEAIIGLCEQTQLIFDFKQKGVGFSKELKERFDELKIPYESKKEGSDVYGINEEIMGNQQLLATLATELKEIEQKLGVKIIKKYVASEKYNYTDETLKGVVRLKNKEERTELIKNIATIASRDPLFQGQNEKNPKVVTDAILELAKSGVFDLLLKKK